MATFGVYGAGQIYRKLGTRKERERLKLLTAKERRNEDETRRLNERAAREAASDERARELERESVSREGVDTMAESPSRPLVRTREIDKPVVIKKKPKPILSARPVPPKVLSPEERAAKEAEAARLGKIALGKIALAGPKKPFDEEAGFEGLGPIGRPIESSAQRAKRLKPKPLPPPIRIDTTKKPRPVLRGGEPGLMMPGKRRETEGEVFTRMAGTVGFHRARESKVRGPETIQANQIIIDQGLAALAKGKRDEATTKADEKAMADLVNVVSEKSPALGLLLRNKITVPPKALARALGLSGAGSANTIGSLGVAAVAQLMLAGKTKDAQALTNKLTTMLSIPTFYNMELSPSVATSMLNAMTDEQAMTVKEWANIFEIEVPPGIGSVRVDEEGGKQALALLLKRLNREQASTDKITTENVLVGGQKMTRLYYVAVDGSRKHFKDVPRIDGEITVVNGPLREGETGESPHLIVTGQSGRRTLIANPSWQPQHEMDRRVQQRVAAAMKLVDERDNATISWKDYRRLAVELRRKFQTEPNATPEQVFASGWLKETMKKFRAAGPAKGINVFVGENFEHINEFTRNQ